MKELEDGKGTKRGWDVWRIEGETKKERQRGMEGGKKGWESKKRWTSNIVEVGQFRFKIALLLA